MKSEENDEIKNEKLEKVENVDNNENANSEIKQETIEKQEKKNKNFIIDFVKRIAIVLILLVIIIFVLLNSKYYKDDRIKDKANLIINNNNVTARLKNDLIIKDDIIYLSMKDIKNFLDNNIYEEQKTNKIITTSDTKVAELSFDEKTIKVNGNNNIIKASAIKENDEIYLPISELQDVYDIEIKYTSKTDIVTIDSLDRKQKKATATSNLNVKLYTKFLSLTVDKIKKDEKVIVIKDLNNGWTKVRTENGKIGFVQTSKLSNIVMVREDANPQKQIDGKINMFWDYYSEYVSAPDRKGQKIEGVNVVSPSFFYINNKGEFKEKVGEAGKEYIKWAKDNGYKVWPMVSNSEAGIKVTSALLNNYESRQEIIEKLVVACQKYDLDGINIDFEFMYQKDKDVFSRFIIELTPRMKEMGLVTSVDLTAPDGSANWSLCYDRYILGKVADYLVFMAYDQYGTSSTSAGTTAGYDWIELSLNKFITTYEVDSEKIILGMPFYTRIWTETLDGSLSSKVVNMKNIESVIPSGVEKEWKDDVKQYYIEYQTGSTTKKMWIEDEASIKEKVNLVSKYKLAGVSCWEKDREVDTIWEVIDKELNK